MSPRRVPPLLAVARWPVRPLVRAASAHRWIGLENIPPAGGAILASNHLSVYDPIIYGDVMLAVGASPRFLAKDTLFDVPVLGGVLRSIEQIPVQRGTSHAGAALDMAAAAVEAGEIVTMFPEGTLTRDPDDWPMRGRLGAARLALRTGAPLIPSACWGTRQIWPVHARGPRLWPRRTVTVSVGRAMHPVRRTGETEREAAIRATGELMSAITTLLAQIRHEQPPAQLHDPRTDAVRPEEGK